MVLIRTVDRPLVPYRQGLSRGVAAAVDTPGKICVSCYIMKWSNGGIAVSCQQSRLPQVTATADRAAERDLCAAVLDKH